MQIKQRGGPGLPSGIKSALKYGTAFAVGLELASLAGSYVLWRKMNRDQDFRFKVHQAAPYALNYYYKIGEKLGSSSARQEDARAWGIKTD